jgi:hypothetical protein
VPTAAVSIRHPQALCGVDVVNADPARPVVLPCIEGDFLAFEQATHSSALKRTGVDEHVPAAIIGLNEAETSSIIVELHGAVVHKTIPSLI